MPKNLLLSILIASITERQKIFLPRVLESLEAQVRNKPVEILVLTDNRMRSIGEKRNRLLSLAQGEYLCFVDDDDQLSPNYVDHIVEALATRPDCVVFDAWVTLNGKSGKICKYGKEFTPENTAQAYFRKPNHLMVHKKDKVKDIKFLDINFGEDDEWANRVVAGIETQVRINEVLYNYEYSRQTSRSGRK
jgi:glycosyltransferase involved in cell wall biosynthesis